MQRKKPIRMTIEFQIHTIFAQLSINMFVHNRNEINEVNERMKWKISNRQWVFFPPIELHTTHTHARNTAEQRTTSEHVELTHCLNVIQYNQIKCIVYRADFVHEYGELARGK